ncbi:rod shape-determining protein MreD [Gloeobacter kilaueensis]|uniref:Cell shape-determining protein n=1 Tax=Gloeobacter kilaueensis (strain ATCC BAA-2537 / CCAP 1431/1 / ULC 316 / JS1) TaxID=1183438 RepID=U5QCL4_GLOK1|nr:rod shape-determining protein MreD [Gloeobacter kilaueensis]AGY56662.1 cell shape-determining protein [Gloeobacter kilaueensis JS1]
MQPSLSRQIVNGIGTFLSAICALLALFAPVPGWAIAGISVDWPLIWIVCFSIRRTPLMAGVAGLAMGWAQDGITMARPTHALGLALAAVLTARLEKQRFIQEDFISVALITFAMAVLSETCMALQYSIMGHIAIAEIWSHHQWVALGSALISSLWAPLVYLPLRWWWRDQADNLS